MSMCIQRQQLLTWKSIHIISHKILTISYRSFSSSIQIYIKSTVAFQILLKPQKCRKMECYQINIIGCCHLICNVLIFTIFLNKKVNKNLWKYPFKCRMNKTVHILYTQYNNSNVLIESFHLNGHTFRYCLADQFPTSVK